VSTHPAAVAPQRHRYRIVDPFGHPYRLHLGELLIAVEVDLQAELQPAPAA
jgi:hypothetical protein